MSFSIFKLTIISFAFFEQDWPPLGKPVLLEVRELAASQFGYDLFECVVIKILGLEGVKYELSWIFGILLIFDLFSGTDFTGTHFLKFYIYNNRFPV